MNQTARQEIGPKALSEGTINNESTLLTGFWERTRTEAPKAHKVDVFSKVIRLVKGAKESVILYSPKVTLSQLVVELEKAHHKNIRIYALATDLKTHQKVFKHGIMRANKDISSTFVLVDPKKNAKGIWFHGELISQSKPGFVLELDDEQIQDALIHFSYLFWRADGQELFFQRIRNCAPFHGSIPDASPRLDRSFRDDGFDLLGQNDISFMAFPFPKPDDFEHHLLAEKLCVELRENARDLAMDIDLGQTEVLAVQKLPFGYTALENGEEENHVIFGWDIGFFLNEEQKRSVIEALPDPYWTYNDKKTIGEIAGKLVPTEHDWNEKRHVRIEQKGVIPLGNIKSGTIDDWLSDLPKPQFPDEIQLFRQIEYHWKLLPPQLPHNSKKHRLYAHWDKFDQGLGKHIDKIIEELNQALSKEKKFKIKKTKMITKKSKWNQWVKDLEGIKREEWRYKRDTGDAKRAIEQVEGIQNEFREDVTGIGKEKKDEKKEESNELEEYLSLKKKPHKLNVQIPFDTLPTESTLYEQGGKTYLTVKYVEEIEPAKTSARRYKALIVAERGE